ncbi:MAG: polysaccharide biosynthesis C-terminal domain-containing protein [Vicinamibacterales bacterium]
MRARVKSLFKNLAIYGFGDVATSLVSLLLLPVYTRYLTPSDYGIIAMLLTVEAVAKIVFRWGVDTAFMRLYYDCADAPARQRLASTLFFFLLAVNGSLIVAVLAASDWLSARLFGTAGHALLVALVIGNTFVVSFSFIPLQVLRIGEQSAQFISLVFGRSVGTLLARLVLVIGAGMGVLGIVVADVIVTAMFTIVLIRWYAPLIRPVFSRQVLKAALGFGLPRIPHSLAQQVIGLADRYFLVAFGTLRDVGLYSIGASFGLALKLFLSAFEYAWTPFFLGAMREPDAKRIYSTVSTYAIAALILLVAGLCAVAADVVRLATTVEFHTAAAVTPWIALGVMFQGLYLVGSIGLIITRRTSRYPLATGCAAAVSLVSNALLIPRYGFLGAAWANTIAYCTLAIVTVGFSWRLYPIPYEWSRLFRIALAGGVAYIAAVESVPASVPPVAGILLRGSMTVGCYALVLFVTRFFHAGEVRVLQDIRRRVLPGKIARAPEPESNQVEMAGEILSGPSDAAVPPAERPPRSPSE